MRGELEAYFEMLGGVGRRVLATDELGHDMSLDEAITWTIGEAQRTKRDGTRVYFIGNGGSAAICSHMAADWMRNGNFAATALNDGAALTCFANDHGYAQVFAAPLSRLVQPSDLLIAISSSGQSANILSAIPVARARKATILTLSGFEPSNPLRVLGDMNFYVPNNQYGFVEIAHLTICHAILDLAMGWRQSGTAPSYATYSPEEAT